MTSVRNYRIDFRNVVRIMSSSLIGKPFKFEYRSMGLGGEKFVASYDGEKMVNCKFSVNADGAEDKSVVIVPINYIKVPPTAGAIVKRMFNDGNSVEVETMIPCEGGDYESYVGAASANADAVEALKKEVNEIRGDNPDSETAKTPQIDNNEEMKNFLEGYNNQQRLKDVLPKSMTDEEYQAVRNLIK